MCRQIDTDVHKDSQIDIKDKKGKWMDSQTQMVRNVNGQTPVDTDGKADKHIRIRKLERQIGTDMDIHMR